MSTEKKNSPAVNTVMTYLFLMFIPIFFTMLLGVFYQSTGVPIFKDVLCFPEILFNGFAACSFYYYITHTKHLRLPCEWTKALFSFAYALSSYLLAQEHDLGYLTLYVLLPLLFLSFERFLSGEKSLPFVLLFAVCLLIDLFAAGALAVCFAVLFFFETPRQSFGEIAADFLHYLALIIFALLLSGFLTIPRLVDHAALLSKNITVSYRPTYPVSVFLSRFLMGSVFYQMLGYFSGISLYVGLFSLLGVFLYFVNPAFSARERIKTLSCLGILLLTLELGPIRDLMKFGDPLAPATVYYCFFFLFWFLRLGIRGILSLHGLSVRRMVAGTAGALLFVALTLCGSAHNFHIAAILGNFLLLLLYGALLLLWRGKKQNFALPIRKVGVVLGMLELLLHAFFCTNASLVPDTASGNAYYVWDYAFTPKVSYEAADPTDAAEAGDVSASVTVSAPLYIDEYTAFIEEHDASDFIGLISQLSQTVSLSEEEIAAADPYALTSSEEIINLLCRKVGADADLLLPLENVRFDYPENERYTVTPEGHSIYNLACDRSLLPYDFVNIACDITLPAAGPVIITEDYANSCFLLEPQEDNETFACYFHLPNAGEDTLNYRLGAFALNSELAKVLPALLEEYAQNAALSAPSRMPIYYVGTFCTLLGVFGLLCLCFYNDRQKLINLLLGYKQKIASSKALTAISGHCSANRVYYLAFLLPFSLFLLALACLRCAPFGPYSLLDQDGILSIFPDYLNMYHCIKEGNFHLNWNIGFLSTSYPINIFRYPLALLPDAGMIATVMVLSVGVMLSVASVTTVYYLANRLSAPQADKGDYLLLIPGLIFSLNTFMLAMSGYVDWFSTYMVLPLIFLSLDRLIYQKKWHSYVLLLGFCMYMNIQLALYICIALFLVFFTYRFDNFLDFFRKGLRFALCSILSACVAFLRIGPMFLYAKGGTTYAAQDSVRPTFRFFGSFLDQWKNLMVLSPATAVSTSDIHINIYMGVITLFLILASFMGSQVTKKTKLKRLLFLAVLLFSFNEQITAYVINGMHYQSNVPNRHTFLLLFLCAVISYDGIRTLPELSKPKLGVITLLLLGFFTVCQFASAGNPMNAFCASMILVLVFGGLCLLYNRGKTALLLLTFELAVNLLFTTSDFIIGGILNFGNYPAQMAYNTDTLKLKGTGYRAITPSYALYGDGSFINAPGIAAFSPYVSIFQKRLAVLYGYKSGVNYVLANYDSSPAGNSMASVKYIYLKGTSFFPLPDLAHYNYIGKINNTYLFENPWVFPLGVYAPKELPALYEENLHTLSYINRMVNLYCGDTVAPLYEIGFFNEYSATGEDKYAFVDPYGAPLSDDEAFQLIVTSLDSPGKYFPIRDLKIELDIRPRIDGPVYLYAEELISLGDGKADTPMHSSIYYPSPSTPENCIWTSFNQDTWETFYQTVMEQTLEDIVVKDNRITGTTHYKEDGYTMFSLPYADSWEVYIDGQRAAISNPMNAYLLVETPAGDHTMELIYNATSPILEGCIAISRISLAFTLLCCAASAILGRRRRKNQAETA